MTGACALCGEPVEGAHPDTPTPVCAVCRSRPSHHISASGARPGLRPANPQLLADALLALRNYVLSDAVPEVRERPRYLTSSTGEKK